jgi:alpha/beta superfamily hydrolase
VAEIRTFFIDGPAGRLEAVLNAGAPDAKYAALVCHPHPLFGGTLHNKVVYHAMKALHGFGFPVLRFNFRGTGLSEGRHDQGGGEVDDVRAALDWLDQEFHLPIIFCGFSFGAATGLRAACPDQRVKALISLGTPVEVDDRLYRYSFLRECLKPKLFVSGGRDQFGPREKLEEVFAEAAEPKRIVFVEGTEHFFEKKLDEMQAAIRAWLPDVLVHHGGTEARSS